VAIAIGLIGAGKHGQRYIRHIRNDVPALTLAALARRDADSGRAQARDLDCRFHADWRDLVADPRVDAVVAVVPPTLHSGIAATVATAGKPLLIEKPLAVTGRAAGEIVRRLRAAGVPALMAHTLRWNPVVRAVRDRLPALGPLRALYVNQRFEPSQLGWLDDPTISGGGMILHTGVHSFDLVRFLTGCEVTRVWCRSRRTHTVRTEDNFTAQLELDGSDALVTVNGCRATLGRSGLIDVAAADGQIVADHQLGFAYAVRGLERTPIELPAAPVNTVCEALLAFVDVIRGVGTPPVTLEDGAKAVSIAEACTRAAAADGPVAVEPLAVD
jgi:predicted dehydrogenase